MTSQETLERLRKAREPKLKKPYVGIAKKSAKKLAQEAAEKEERGGKETELKTWYLERQKQLTGKCVRCGTRYDHRNLKYAICSTAHIFPKRADKFPSVKCHPDNFIELCASCGCHKWFDEQATWEEVALDKIWPLVLERFLLFEPKITERSKIPDLFLQEIKPKT